MRWALVAATLRYFPALATEPEPRLSAIGEFYFNLGAWRLQTPNLRRRVKQREGPAAAAELRRWVYGCGTVSPRLVRQRNAEGGPSLVRIGSGLTCPWHPRGPQTQFSKGIF